MSGYAQFIKDEQEYAKAKMWAGEDPAHMELARWFMRLAFINRRDDAFCDKVAPLYQLQAYNLSTNAAPFEAMLDALRRDG